MNPSGAVVVYSSNGLLEKGAFHPKGRGPDGGTRDSGAENSPQRVPKRPLETATSTASGDASLEREVCGSQDSLLVAWSLFWIEDIPWSYPIKPKVVSLRVLGALFSAISPFHPAPAGRG